MVKSQTKPRKVPSQARSKAMVEAILEATVRVLLSHGYAGTTTIRVAERAGVSVGSLYQYFPNKDALITMLVDRHARQILDCVERAIASADDDDDPASGVRTLVRASLDAHRIAPALHKILVEEIPRVGKMAKAMDTSKKITAILERYLSRHRAHLVVRDTRLAAFVVETTVEALTHRAVVEEPELIGTKQLEREAIDMVTGYLFGRDRPRGPRKRRD